MRRLLISRIPSLDLIFYQHPWLLRAAIILGAILFSMVPALLTTNVTYLVLLLVLVVALLMGIGTVLYLLKRPEAGILAILITAGSIPFALGTGTGSALPPPVIVLVLMVGLWFLDMWRQRSFRLVRSRTIPPILALSAVALAAFILGNPTMLINIHTASITARIGGLAIYLLSALAFLLVAHQIKDIKWLERMVWIVLVLAVLSAIRRLGGAFSLNLLPIIPSGLSGSVFWIWALVLPFGQMVFNGTLTTRKRVLLGTIFVFLLFVRMIVGQSWTSGWMPPLIAIAVTFAVGAPNLSIFVGALAVLGALTQLDKVVGFVMVGDNEYSLTTRLAAWANLLQMIKVSPFLGLGPANYYWQSAYTPIMGWWVPYNSHNNYVDILAQTGALGMACFLWFHAEAAGLALRLRNALPDGFARAFVLSAVGATAGTLAGAMLGDWVIPFVYNVGLDGTRSSLVGWMFFGGLIVIEKTLRKKEES